MKKRSMLTFILILLLLSGCRLSAFGGQVVIDWVDFIHLDGKEYNGIHSGVLADESFIGEKVGTVKFKVADNVKNPSYKIRDGDAAFHEKGTEIFQIKDHPHLIAVKDTHSVNGYRVYFSRDDIKYQWHFRDMPLEKVERIEVYQTDPPAGNQLIFELTKSEDIKGFLQLLVDSEENPNFRPNNASVDPLFYEMFFYTDEPIAYKYYLQFDGDTYFWNPWDTSIISDEIQMFIGRN
ncbi:hypothetical protein [Sporosarcina sp. Marseille-Q4943]|uniref:hypothetical protein n=1 Tax=Sporosarcina sp. Marseille-Q4943 TaxID=2942204 RepID=UPI00208DB4BF|nr:hypothetical protein [Sporosarcina sp. Marseille-Q4943]